jgi:hypothetical protein
MLVRTKLRGRPSFWSFEQIGSSQMALPPRQLVPKHSEGSSAILKPPHRRQDRRQQMCPRSTTRASTDQPTCGTQKNMDTTHTHTHTHTHTPKLRAHASTSVTLGPPVAWMEGASGGLSLLQAGCNAATLRRCDEAARMSRFPTLYTTSLSGAPTRVSHASCRCCFRCYRPCSR